MAYTPQSWADNDVTKPVSAARMNYIEAGLSAVANGGSLSFIGAFNVKDVTYGAKGDAKVVTDGAITTGTAALTSATGSFAPSDVGKPIAVAGAGAAGIPLVTTILAYVSATAVTLNASATLTVSAASVVWGTDDTAAIQAAHNAMLTTGGELYFPAGSYYITSAITINRITTIRGAGSGSASHTKDALTRLITASTTNDGLNVTAGGLMIEDVQLYNISGAETAGVGIHVTSGSYMHINRVGVWGFNDCLAIDVGIYYTVEASYFLNAVRYGIRIQNTSVADAGDGFIGSGTVVYPRSTGSTSGIRWETGGGLKIEGVKINANGAGGFAKGIDAAIADGAATSVFIVDGNSVEGCSNTAISVTQQGTTGVFGKVILTANEIGPSGTTPTGIAVISTTVGDITDLIVGDNFISSTTNGIQIDGASTITIGNNEITGAQSDSGISIKNVAGGLIAPNTITGQWTNGAVNIKSSGTPSSGLSIDHQNIISAAGSQTLVLDSSSGVSSSLKRNRIVYDETREITGVGTTFVTVYQVLLPAGIGAGGVLEFSVEGVVTAGSPTGDAFAIYGKRLVTVTIGNVTTLTTIGTDVVAGTTFDYQFDTATANTVKLQIRVNPTQAGTSVHGQVHVKYDGPLQRFIRN